MAVIHKIKPTRKATPMALKIFDAVLERLRAIQGDAHHYQWVYYHLDGCIANPTAKAWLEGKIKTTPQLNSLTKVAETLGIDIRVVNVMSVKKAKIARESKVHGKVKPIVEKAVA